MAERRTIVANGVAQSVVVAGDGPPLVLIHGLGWQADLWDRQIEKFGKDFRVIAPDLRGHGRSEAPSEQPRTQAFADDIDALLGALGVVRAAFVGFSLGGPVVMDLALRSPSRVTAAVFACCSTGSNPGDEPATHEFIDHARALGPRAFAEEQANMVFSARWAAQNPDAVATFIEKRSAMDFESLLATFRSGFGTNFAGRLRDIAVPSLVIAADDDPFVSEETVKGIASQLPNAEFQRIAPSGHHVSLEQPDAFDALLSRFLSTHYKAEVAA